MSIEEVIGRIQLRIRETETIHIKGRGKKDPSRIYFEGLVEGMKEALGYITLIGENNNSSH